MTKLAQQYDTVLRRFQQNGNKLFLVDDSKNVQAQTLARLLTDCKALSAVVVTEDVVTAREYARLLGNDSRTFEVADKQSFVAAFGSEILPDQLSKAALKLRREHPWLVVPKNDGEDVLFAALCTDDRSSGTYYFANKTEQGKLRVIDLIAEARYDAVAIDDVYRFVSLKEGRALKEKLTPVNFDRVDFCGRTTYQSTSTSYKKLKYLVDSGKNRVLLSDCIADSDTVGLYAVLNLLNDAFNYFEARDAFAKAFDDYEQDISDIFRMIVNAHDDELVVSRCFSEASSTDLRCPASEREMAELISSGIDFMSEEETVLHSLYAYGKMYKRSAIGKKLVEDVQENEYEMGKCLCALLFYDDMKGELDDITEERLCTFSDKDYNIALKLFNKYGGLYLGGGDLPKLDVVQISCEGSGFEYLYRDGSTDRSTARDLCTLANQVDDAVRCQAISHLLTEEGSNTKLPMLVIANGNCERIAAELSKLTGAVQTDLHELSDNPRAFAVIDYDELRRTAANPHPISAVFYDLPHEIGRFGRYRNKVADFGAAAVALTDFNSLGSRILTVWDKINEGVEGILPLNVYEVALKNDKTVSSGEVFKAADELVQKLSRLSAACGDPDSVAETIFNVIKGYTPQAPNDADIAIDVGFLKEVGEPFNKVFANSVSVGGIGEISLCKELVRVASTGKKQRTRTETRETLSEQQVLFNVCAKMLLRNCNLEVNDCHGCPLYKELKHNDSEAYTKGLTEFADGVQDYCDKVFNQLKDVNVTMRSVGSDDAEQFRQLASKNDKNRAAMKPTRRENKARAPFVCDYETVAKRKQAVGDVYDSVLSKYTQLVNDLCNEVADKLARSIKTIQRGYKL